MVEPEAKATERPSEDHVSEVRDPERHQRLQRERRLYDSKRKRLQSALRTLRRSNPSYPKTEEKIMEELREIEETERIEHAREGE